MDGMVAIEAGKQTADGAFWNEQPDRVADALILVGLGIAAGSLALGWAAAALAISTAYVRELGKGIDGVVDFSGPMAKPHRMALVTGALIGAALLSLVFSTEAPGSESIDSSGGFFDSGLVIAVLELSLWLLCAGCAVTVYRRCQRLLKRLQD